MRAWAHETYRTYERPGLEGDDVLGILATHPTLIPGEKIVVSLDKDLRSVPCTLVNYGGIVNPKIKETPPQIITVDEADRFHMQQALTGDRVDGYPGCPGVGPVRAARILGGCTTISEMWVRVVHAYQEKGLGEEIALQNARVARICRAQDYNFTTKEVILWTPPMSVIQPVL
jgi:DNA polymerase-1